MYLQQHLVIWLECLLSSLLNIILLYIYNLTCILFAFLIAISPAPCDTIILYIRYYWQYGDKSTWSKTVGDFIGLGSIELSASKLNKKKTMVIIFSVFF